ncbi:MAG: DUF3810 family protein [Spirochaetales bacterium]|nr:DUF3810 family protein [Spirochaetales bacterium]
MIIFLVFSFLVFCPWFPDFFSSLGIGGIFIPFTGEPLVNPGPGGPSLAFDAAHEMSHERGWAREDEANFLAFLVLSQSGKADLEYAADLMGLMYTEQALGQSGPAGLKAQKASIKRLSPQVVRDWNAYVLYWRRFAGPVQNAAQAVNDSYLKTQGQKDGVRSYGRMVDLLLTYERALQHPSPGGHPSVLEAPKSP